MIADATKRPSSGVGKTAMDAVSPMTSYTSLRVRASGSRAGHRDACLRTDWRTSTSQCCFRWFRLFRPNQRINGAKVKIVTTGDITMRRLLKVQEM